MSFKSYNVLDGNEAFKRFKVAGDGTNDNPFVPIMRLEVTPDVTSVTGWSDPLSDDNVASEKIIKETIDNQELTAVSFDSNTGIITFEKEKGDLSVNIAAGLNKFIQSATFDTNNGVLTFTYNDLTTTTVDLDGRYSITLDESIDNQGTTPVTMNTDTDVRISNDTGWAFQDPTGATDLFKVYRQGTTNRISANAFFMTFNNGATATWQKGLNVAVSTQGIQIGVEFGKIKTTGVLKLDTTNRVEINNALHVDTNGQTIKIGDSNGLIQTDGALTIETINSNNFTLNAGNNLYLDDGYRAASSRTTPLDIASSISEWSALAVKYGTTTSLIDMLNQAITSLSSYSVTALNDVTSAGSGEIITVGERDKITQITVTQPVDLDAMESDIAANNLKVTNATHTGDVTGSNALTISNDVVDNLKLTNMATGTVKGRVSAGTGDPEDIDIDTDLKSALNLTNADVGLSNVQNVDQTNADNITSGTLASARYNDPTQSFTQGVGQTITSLDTIQSLTTGTNSYISRTIGTDFVGTVATEYIPQFANSILANTTLYSYDNTLGEFTLLKAGVYKVSYSIIGEQVSFNKPITWRVLVETGATTFASNWGESYAITVVDTKGHLCSIGNTALIQVATNDKLRLRLEIAKDDTTFGDTLTGVTVKANSIINIQYLG